jgi:hypothetical protein
MLSANLLETLGKSRWPDRWRGSLAGFSLKKAILHANLI